MKIDELEFFAGELFRIKMKDAYLKSWNYESDMDGSRKITVEYVDVSKK